MTQKDWPSKDCAKRRLRQKNVTRRRIGHALACGWLWLGLGGANTPAQTPSEPPARIVALFEAGQDAHQAGKLTEALALYDQALALDATLAPLHFQRGIVLLALRRAAEAVAAFEQCAALAPDFPRVWPRLGAAALATGDTAKAEQALIEALDRDPADVPTRLQLARLALARDAPAEALDRLKPLDDPSGEADLLRGMALFQMGRFADAVATLSEGLTKAPNHPVVRRRRGDAYAAQGDVEAALADWQAVYAVTPDGELAAEIAGALLHLRRLEPARSFLKAARSTFPSDARLAALEAELDGDAALGQAAQLLRTGQFAAAAEAYALLVARAPEATAPRAGLATALFKLGRFEEAARHFDLLARRQPDVAATYFFLGICYDKIGNHTGALAAYEAFLARADGVYHRLEIEKIQLRLPRLRRQAEQSKPRKP